MSEIRAPAYLALALAEPDIAAAFRGAVICLSEEVSRLVVDLTNREVAKTLEPLAPPPAEVCWIEIGGDGFELNDDRKNNIRALMVMPKSVLFVTNEYIQGFSHGALLMDFAEGQNWPLSPRPDKIRNPVHDGMSDLLVSVCAVLAAPGVKSNDERVRDKRLRISSAQTAPLVTYRCIDVDIDAFVDQPEGHESRGVERTRGVAKHHVRTHFRVLEKGLVPVRGHWRGDIRYGLRLRDRNIMRNEETH